MRNPIRISGILLLLTFLPVGCKIEKLPKITTLDPYAIEAFSAISGGNITSDGDSPIVSRGLCWNTTQNPTLTDNHTNDGTGPGIFTSTLTGLTPKTEYYIRAYATNDIGTNYGNQVSFTTAIDIIFNPHLNYGSVTDIDGNSYNTIQISTQTWMAENLKTTKFNNGTEIPLVTDGTVWSNLTTDGYCWYNNDASVNKITYGALYNWYTVNKGNLCPTGWHVSSSAEWETMATYLGGVPDHFQKKLKETGTTHWYLNTPGQLHDATNSSGFTALPGGLRSVNGMFSQIRGEGHWWTSTESDATTANSLALYFYDMGGTPEAHAKKLGLSVRCVKD
jgi:uncharacterized protein (TIGR02145 family)